MVEVAQSVDAALLDSDFGTLAFAAATAFVGGIGADPKRVDCLSFGWSIVAIRPCK